MNQGGLGWILLGIATLGLAAVDPDFRLEHAAGERKRCRASWGRSRPLIITWGMIWITVVMSVVLAIYVFAYGLGKVNR